MKRALSFLSVVVLVVLSSNQFVAAQWVQTSGPTGAAVSCLLVSGTKLFAGTGNRFGGEGNGVFVTSDSGAHWTSASSGLQYGYHKGEVICLASVRENTSSLMIFAGTDSGVFHSTNDGASWSGWSNGLPKDCYVTAIAAIGTSLVAAAAGGGSTQEMFLSTDSGLNWTPSYQGLVGGSAWVLAVKGNDLFAGTNNGVFVSSDSARSWKQLNRGLTDTMVISLAVSGTTVFAGTVGGGVYTSTNNGSDWTAANTGISPSAVVAAFAATDNLVFCATLDHGIFLTTNNGTSWVDVGYGLTDTAITAVALNGEEVFAGTKHGVWRRPLSEMIGHGAVTAPSPAQYAMLNYPNPFSTSTKISLTTPGGYTKIVVTNLLGTEVAHLFEGRLAVGKHSFTWDANMMPRGIYQCVLQTSEQIHLVTMMVVR